VDRLGYDTVDAGSMTGSWRVRHGSPAYVVPYQTKADLAWSQDPGSPAPAAKIRAALTAAHR
jgi:hypothetical protein